MARRKHRRGKALKIALGLLPRHAVQNVIHVHAGRRHGPRQMIAGIPSRGRAIPDHPRHMIKKSKPFPGPCRSHVKPVQTLVKRLFFLGNPPRPGFECYR